MRRKNLSYIAFSVLLLIAVIFVFTRRGSTIRRDQLNFAVDQPSQIDRIVIWDNDNQADIMREGNSWKLNKNVPAKNESVEFFFQILNRIEVRAPASKSMRDSLILKLEQRGTHISLYHGNHLLKSLHVYYENKDVPGTYIMDQHSREPFRIGLTGYAGDNIQPLFSAKESGWMDNLLIDFMPGEMVLIQVEYPQKPEQSFRIRKNEKSTYELQSLYSVIPADSVNPEVIRDYLNYFSAIRYAGVADKRDILQKSPDSFVLLTIINEAQQQFQMAGFQKMIPGEKNPDMNRYLAVNSLDSFPVIVNYTETDPIMKVFSDFLKK